MSTITIDAQLGVICAELLDNGITLAQARDAVEAKYIALALLKARGNKTRAGSLLGVHRNTLHNKLRPEMSPAERRLRKQLAATQRRSAEIRSEIDRQAKRKRADRAGRSGE
jgi:hypothetical protein